MPRWLSLSLAALLAMSGMVAIEATVAPTPAQAASAGNILPPFAAGETWYVYQGYNDPGPLGTHHNSQTYPSLYGLDLTYGGTSNTASAGKNVYAPVGGTIQGNPTLSSAGSMCINMSDGRSLTLTHINTGITGGNVTAGQLVGTVAAAGTQSNNGVAHVHLQMWSGGGCWNTGNGGIPFDSGHNARICGAPDLTATGATNTWHNTPITGDTCGVSVSSNLHLSSVGTDGKVYTLGQTSPGAWSPNWSVIEGNVQSTSITTTSDGLHHIAALGGDGNVYITDQQSNLQWSGWTQIPAQVTHVTIAATSPDNKLHIATIGTNGKIYVLDQLTSGGAWSSNWTEIMAGGLTSISMTASPLNGKLHIAVTGNDFNVYVVSQSATTGAWGGWSQVPAQVTQVAIAATPEGKLHIATRGTDGKVYVLDEVNVGGPWSSSWTFIDADNVASVSMASASNGKLNIASKGGDGNIYVVSQSAATGAWSGWSQVQAQITQVAIAA